ncbi:hypothetical protein [Rubeoparvulum massiliense]|uniref:hypothetical protein n=1 Tax=Rubeoparvulum massiliense TaxID=1631346 RepID=UPI00065E5DAF|nr:hypothetical protein [Rubeoparvulum massiliense]
MALIVRILILLSVFLLAVLWLRYLFNPKRKLELAHEKKETMMLDDPQNIRKNFLITYQGTLFEGEKYLGTTDEQFSIIHIFVWARRPDQLQGFVREDFHVIEKLIREHYPDAKIEWKSPIKEFLKGDTMW